MEGAAMRIEYSCACDIGLRRRANQDNFFCDGVYLPHDAAEEHFFRTGSIEGNLPRLFGVFDGLGGEERGEMAAFIAAEEAAAFDGKKVSAHGLGLLCRRINQRICTYAETHGIFSMGTTAAMLVFEEDRLFLCNIGDSRIFRLGNNGPEQLSMDHLASAPPGHKAPLSQNLGIPEDLMLIEPYIRELTYSIEEVFVICSDGLTDMVSFEEMWEIFKSCLDSQTDMMSPDGKQEISKSSPGDLTDIVNPAGMQQTFENSRAAKHSEQINKQLEKNPEKEPGENLAKKLVEKALQNGGKDNVTVLVVRPTL